MSNTPGDRLQPQQEFWLGPIFAKLDHLGFQGESYGIALEDLCDKVKQGYDRAALIKEEVPPAHSAYSTKLPEGHRQKMSSRGLPY